jgi:hypothetical protein
MPGRFAAGLAGFTKGEELMLNISVEVSGRVLCLLKMRDLEEGSHVLALMSGILLHLLRSTLWRSLVRRVSCNLTSQF